MLFKKLTILVVSISVALVIGYALLFARPGQPPKSPPQERVVGEVIRTEEIQCDDEMYVFEMVLNEGETGYFNNIYRNTTSAENFVTSIKALPRGGNTFYLLTAPRENCDRIYLTVALYETDTPRSRIFEWRIADNTLHELSISESFQADLAINYPDGLEKVISPDGEKAIVAQANEPYSQKNVCNLHTLLLLRLREDEEEVLVQLSDEEALTTFSESNVGECPGINIGWIDDSTIYYDVYDATSEEWIYPLIERRTLLIQ